MEKNHKALITGIGVISDLGTDYASHKNNLLSLKNGISKEEFKNGDKKIEAFVGKVKTSFEIPEQFNDSYKNLQLSIKAVKEAIFTSKVELKRFKKVAIVIGTSLGGKVVGQQGLYKFRKNDYQLDFKSAKQKYLQNIADEILNFFNIDATVYVISTACSASNNAAILGSQMIQSGSFDLVIAGGSDELADVSIAGFSSLGAINEKMSAQPYSNGKGISLGEGAGFIVLENEETARNKKVFAEIVGGAISSDSYHITAPDPKGEGAEYIINEALSNSGLNLVDINYVNGHGTGTAANDNMEMNLLGKKFPKNTVISSTKAVTGHTLGAAGIIEIINSICMIEEQKVVGTLNIEHTTNDIPSNFFKNGIFDKKINYALSLSFAFGGNNSCIIIAKPDTYHYKLKTFAELSNYGIEKVYATGLVENKVQNLEQSTHFELYTNDLQGYKFNNFKLDEKVNPTIYRRLDEYSKMVVKSTAKALKDFGINYKKIDSHKIGLLFSTPSGAVRTVEHIEESIPKVGYNKVSASEFPYTVLNAAAGVVSLAFGIKGPTSVISASGTGYADVFQYAKYFVRQANLDYLLIINATQISDYELFGWKELGFSELALPADYVTIMLLQKDLKNPNIKVIDECNKRGQSVELYSLINEFLNKNTLTVEDITGIVFNTNRQSNSNEYVKITRLLTSLKNVNTWDMSDINFWTDGSGEELAYVDKNISIQGNYLLISYSRFGGYSLLLVHKK